MRGAALIALAALAACGPAPLPAADQHSASSNLQTSATAVCMPGLGNCPLTCYSDGSCSFTTQGDGFDRARWSNLQAFVDQQQERKSLGPFSASSNFAADLLGPIDTRPGCYGTADSWSFAVTFHPPAGYRVRVLRLRGDLVAWPRIAPGEALIGTGKYAGVLLGFQTTAPEGSAACDYCADNTMLYIQDATNGGPRRAPFDADVRVGGLLGADNKLVVKVAAWLNTTGHYIHIEPTFTVVYRYERGQ